MKILRKTAVTLFFSVLAVAFALLVTLFAASACSEKVTLRFETDGGSYLPPVEGRAGGGYERPADPEKEGYYFDGWYLDETCSGQGLALPDVMPSASTTYYAGFRRCPVLTLDPQGGKLEKTEYLLRPGENIKQALAGIEPEKEGLFFGGWLFEGAPLGDGDVMEGDARLSACYLAEYRVNVRLQDAADPERFCVSEALSYTARAGEGETVEIKVPDLEHFLLFGDAATSGVLRAGENVFCLDFVREELSVTLDDGLGGEERFLSRYGAEFTLPAPSAPQGLEFFGWEGDGERYAPAQTVVLGHALSLRGVWADRFPSVRGGEALAVERGGQTARAAVHISADGTRTNGVYSEETGLFTAEGLCGRLDGKGGYLPDDSGVYLGYALFSDESAEKYGKLTLDFLNETAIYAAGGAERRGSYVYDYRDGTGYTGDYVFEDGEPFRFRLIGQTFLKEGEEKGVYPAYGERAGASLLLDGYGSAVYTENGSACAGSYCGTGEGDWRFLPEEGEPFRFATVRREWSGADGLLAAENGFLLYRPALAGTYTERGGEDRLVLDGYGLSAVYEHGKMRTVAPFTVEGPFVRLQNSPLRFTLTGMQFALTGEEAGSYGRQGSVLFLDGAGNATLSSGGEACDRGSYVPAGEDWEFRGQTAFRFRLCGAGYAVYDSQTEGRFEDGYGVPLVLDGYGGGTLCTDTGEEFSAEVLCCIRDAVVLYVPGLKTERRVRVFLLDRENGVCEGVRRAEAGYYAYGESGLLLDGRGNAFFEGEQGSYVYHAKEREAVCDFQDGERRFLLSEKNGRDVCVLRTAAGTFRSGESVLSLDGYGNARYCAAGEELEARYTLRGESAEIALEARLLRFELSESGFELSEYRRYESGNGGLPLYLAAQGNAAFLRGEEDICGYCGEGWFLSERLKMAFRVRGEKYYLYDGAQEGVFRSAEETVTLDGCGFALLERGEERLEGTGLLTDDGLLVFSSPALQTNSASLGFRVEGSAAIPLGEEFGRYRSEDGELVLLGDGRARFLEGGAARAGQYLPAEEEGEYLLTAGGETLRLRVFRTEDGGGYALYRPELAALAGEYRAGEDTLTADGYGASLNGASLRFVCAAGGGFLARTEEGGYLFVLPEGETFSLTQATCRLISAHPHENFTEI